MSLAGAPAAGAVSVLAARKNAQAPRSTPGNIALDSLAVAANAASDVLQPDSVRRRERFIPITRFALLDRLTRKGAWHSSDAREARRFFRYLDYWRQQQYSSFILDLEQTYEPFSPDTDLLLTRKFTPDERSEMQRRVTDGMSYLLERANYERIEPTSVEMILTQESYYGLDLNVDMDAFEEILIFYRGASNKKHEKRLLRKFMRKQEFDVPIFQRLFILFKLKPAATRVRELMAKFNLSREEAERKVKHLRSGLPGGITDGNIYMKLFKNIPRTDIEMVFPNTQVRFRLLDKLRLGVTAGGGLGLGIVGAAGKIALIATNPIAAATAAMGLGAVGFRQAMNFMNQKQRYMVVMAQNLYFHSMADNRGVMIKLAARAAEEDFKEEILLYTVLAKERVTRADLPVIDASIEKFLGKEFGVLVNFDLDDALSRLMADGIVKERPDGSFETLSPMAAAQHIDAKWDLLLDELPDCVSAEGFEFEGKPVEPTPVASA